MYANGGEPMIGDIASGGLGEGRITAVTACGLEGRQTVQVEWTTPSEAPKGSGIYATPAPTTAFPEALMLVRRDG